LISNSSCYTRDMKNVDKNKGNVLVTLLIIIFILMSIYMIIEYTKNKQSDRGDVDMRVDTGRILSE